MWLCEFRVEGVGLPSRVPRTQNRPLRLVLLFPFVVVSVPLINPFKLEGCLFIPRLLLGFGPTKRGAGGRSGLGSLTRDFI